MDEVLLGKAAIIERCLKRIDADYRGFESELATNFTRQDAIVLNLQRACEASIDAAMHLVRTHKLGIPTESRQGFEFLIKAGLLDAELGGKLVGMVGFRNVAVHNYQELDIEILRNILVQRLGDLQAFARLLVGRALPKQRGFTMVELIVTMVIIGILAIAVLPRFGLLRGFDEIGFRDQVKATLEYARKSAVAGRRAVRVTIVGSGVTVERQQQTPEGEGTAGWLPLNLPGGSTHTFSAPAGVTLTPDTTLVFDPLGRPSPGATLAVSGAGTITVEAETGYVR